MDGAVLYFLFQILVGLLLLTFLVVIHELGHAIVARRNGIVVEEFGIGFPPKLAGVYLKNGVLFTINWLPLGGFVKMQGENDSASKKGDYGAASMGVKTKVLLAGVGMNWLFAILALSVLAIIGFPKVLPNQFTVPMDTKEVETPLKVTYIDSSSPASKIGLKVNDKIVSVAGQKIVNAKDLVRVTSANQGKKVEVKYDRDGQTFAVFVQLRYMPSSSKGVLGVATSTQTVRYSTWSAPIVGIGTTAQFSYVTLKGLGDLVGKLVGGISAQFSGDQATKEKGSKELSAAGNSVGGPLSIIGVFFPAAQTAGVSTLLFLTAIISLTLAVMNVLPIPALDGGRLFLTYLFKAIRKPLTKELEEKIVGYSFMGLMALVVVITVADVFKIQAL
ncbi:MAG: M50 family metallopeptidase [Candidatus Saccharibacteria bacterium]|nr:M50 family metallopeptidase [Candidatus Saccharibacteria bacterium]